MGGINPHTDHPYAFNEPVPVDGFNNLDELCPPFDLEELNPAIDSDDLDQTHTPSDIYDQLFGHAHVSSREAAEEHRLLPLTSLTYRDVKDLYENMTTRPDRIQRLLKKRVEVKLHPDDRRNPVHPLNQIRTSKHTLDYIFAVSSNPGLTLLLPPKQPPGWKCQIRPYFFPTYIKDRYAVPTCDLDKKYIRFAHCEHFDGFFAFIPVNRNIEDDKDSYPQWFVPLARQGPPPLASHHYIAMSFFLANLFKNFQQSNLTVHGHVYPQAPAPNKPWTLSQLTAFTNLL